MIFDTVSYDPVQIVQTGGVVAVLVLIVVLGAKPRPWWVFGWRYREVTDERDEWKAIALRATNLAELLGEQHKRGG